MILQPNDKSYATINIQHSTQPCPHNNTMTQQSVRPTTPIFATGTNTTYSVPVSSLPGTSSVTTASNKKVATKSSPPTGTSIPNKPVAVKSASKPQRTPRHSSKNVVLGKKSSLPDLTHSQDISHYFFSSQFTTPKITNKSTSKKSINKLLVSNKFSALSELNGDSV